MQVKYIQMDPEHITDGNTLSDLFDYKAVSRP